VNVKLTIDGTKLRDSQMNSGSRGNAIGPLTTNEYDGYVVFQGGHHKVTMPWHILPRKSAEVVAKLPGGKLNIDPNTGTGTVALENKGVGNAQIFAYSMLGTGPDTARGERGDGEPNPTMRAVAVNTFGTPAGAVCSVNPNFVWEFVFNMYERKASPVGTIHEVDIDVNGDGTDDFFVINQDVGGVTALTDGRQVTSVINAATGGSIARFFVEHGTNSSNVILRVCGSDMGLTQAAVGKPMRLSFYAYSWYFGGETSFLGPFMAAPGGEEFTAVVPGDTLAYKQKSDLAVTQWGLPAGADPAAGVLLINNSDFTFFGLSANTGGATRETEATLLPR